MIENKYFMVVAFFIFSCTSTTNLDSDKTTTKTNFKSIIEASYSLKHSPEINRKTALKEKISRIAYYDNQGNVTEYKQFENGDTLYERTILIFNKEGKIIKGKILNANNELKKYWIKTMTKNERLEKLETYSSDKKLIQIQSSSFDNFGNTTELILKNANYDYTNKTKFKYNSKHQIIERKNYNGAKNKTDTRKYFYNQAGNKIEEILIRDNGSKLIFKNQYDNQNNLTIQKWFDETGKQTHETSFIYVYDDYGNWITKKRSSKSKLGYIWERKIEYYKK